MEPAESAAAGEKTDAELIATVLAGDAASFEPLVARYQARIFGTVRKYARRESEVEDIVQEIFLKAYTKLGTFRGDSPFDHWLMRLAVRTCYDFLRQHQRNREHSFTELSDEEFDWIERGPAVLPRDDSAAAASRELLHKVLERMPPPVRLIITLLEIEERSIKEISQLTGWSIALVKVRAFRARQALKKELANIQKDRYL